MQCLGSPAPSAGIRTINNIPNFPKQSLRAGVSRQIYRSLEVSPIACWLVARTELHGGHSGNAKIIHSEGNGAYDEMIIQMANGYSVSGQDVTESRLSSDTLTVHLLIYQIRDGMMGVCFSHSDDARYLGYKQSGVAWMGILKGGKWTTISRKDERKWGER